MNNILYIKNMEEKVEKLIFSLEEVIELYLPDYKNSLSRRVFLRNVNNYQKSKTKNTKLGRKFFANYVNTYI